jgi:hypothetical protein
MMIDRFSAWIVRLVFECVFANRRTVSVIARPVVVGKSDGGVVDRSMDG